MRATRFAILMAACWLVAACASSGGSQRDALEKAQYAWSAAIRWGDRDGAWALLDPAWRDAHPLGEIERTRYQQLQVTRYRPLSSEATPDGGSRRLVEIGVVNRNTMAERTLRYDERWRYDPAGKAWYVASGLPDFWSGQ